MFEILLSDTASAQLDLLRLGSTHIAKVKAVEKTLDLLPNPKTPRASNT